VAGGGEGEGAPRRGSPIFNARTTFVSAVAFLGDVVTGDGGRMGEGGKGIEWAGFVSGSLEGAGRGSGRIRLSAIFVVVAVPDLVDSV